MIRAQQKVTLCIDFFYINAKHIFLMTYSENICFTTNSHVFNRKVKSYWPMLKAVCLMYEARGLHIIKVKADLEFLPLVRELVNELPTSPVTEFAAQGMHVGPVERNIRYNKEKARSLRYTLPFDKILKVMVIHMMFTVTIVMNMFPRKGGNAIYSPQMIMTGRSVTIDDLNISFGSYVQFTIRGCSPKLPARIFGIEREHTSQGWRGEVRRIQSENGKFWQRLISAR